ncbi:MULTISPECIES: penicillin-binding protein activator LpoB [Providencia]|uniref:Penicillin-binding protein activator LpoB n=2 Tax=Providencia TaxID=586 RepID=A0AA42FKX4_9GAMM|nr:MULTISPECIES: penicillin-binding protein activator LpoB [Providencia]HCI95894.1 penicillin-binding protein activator LpoB [Providencia sp.]APC12218.1 Penicillin-binding protein activator LpoB precursor [Providencia rettgeri]AVL75573.1 penicillin-binding protein activator LpoB [Providencia rettgeri]EIU7557542.1 penicillin-binding protein activator LpoB [Providencia rettgeri]EJD6044134.1 penicillin-binding protein activator LpoB [Providencia rettgeri]
MKRILMVAVAALILAGCPSYPPQQPGTQPPIVPVEPDQPPEVTPPPTDVVPTPPKQQTTDWAASITPLVGQMVAADGVESGKVLLVDSVKNNTNGSLPVQTITSTMASAVENTNRFKVVPQSVVSSARKTLGLSQEDSLVTRSKAIGLGRYVQADYVIYSVMSGSNKDKSLEMQLMEVQTGEIIWTGKHSID